MFRNGIGYLQMSWKNNNRQHRKSNFYSVSVLCSLYYGLCFVFFLVTECIASQVYLVIWNKQPSQDSFFPYIIKHRALQYKLFFFCERTILYHPSDQHNNKNTQALNYCRFTAHVHSGWYEWASLRRNPRLIYILF